MARWVDTMCFVVFKMHSWPQTCKCLDKYDVTSSNDLWLAGRGGQWKALGWSYRWLMNFGLFFLSHAVRSQRPGSLTRRKGVQLPRLVSVYCLSLEPRPHTHHSHPLAHPHTPLPHHTSSHTPTHTHPLMHPNKHASHTRQMCWWWRCSRRKDSHSPGCLGVQRGRVLETSISSSMWQHTSTHPSTLWV